MFETVPGQTIKDQFPAWEDDGFTKTSGLSVVGGDFTVTVWQDCAVSGLAVTITEIGVSGEYCIEYTPPTEGIWVVEVKLNGNMDVWKSSAFVGASADLTSVKADLARILGLLHHNAMLDLQTYDAEDQLLSARLRVFNTASNVPAEPGHISDPFTIQEYLIQAEYSATNRSRKYTLKRVL